MNKRKILILVLLPLLLCSFLSVGYSQLVADTSIISLSGDDWSIKVDGTLETALDSKALPYVSVKSATEKELFLTLNSLKDCQSGVVEFKVDVQGLTAYKQLPLTQKEIDEGSFRPQNVVNSFALFDSSGRKQAHIYASKLIDAKGVEVWLDQDLQDGLLTVYLPKLEILETLSFPLLLDPTFGYLSEGASSEGTYVPALRVCRFTLSEEANLVSIHMYLKTTSGGTDNVNLALYNDSSSNPNYLVANVTLTVTGASPEWYYGNITGTIPAGDYHLGWIADNAGVTEYYDSGSADQSHYVLGVTYPTLPDPFGSPAGSDSQKISIYVYYETGGEPTPTPTPTASPTPAPTGTPTITPFPEGDMNDTDWYISILILVLIIINLVLMTLPFALVRFVFGILSLFLCMLALAYAIPLSPYLQTAGLLVSVLGMLFAVRARE